MRWQASLLLAVPILISAAPQPPQDPQAKYEPSSKPGPGQQFLERFVGDWDVAKTFYPRTGEPARTSGTCRQRMIHAGHFLQSDFVFQQDGQTTTGTGTIGFEPETGKFTSVWVDSRQTRMSLRASRDRFDGEKIVLFSASLEGDGKEARRSKTVTTLEDTGRRLVHRQYALSPDGQERLMMELVMTRRETSKPAQ